MPSGQSPGTARVSDLAKVKPAGAAPAGVGGNGLMRAFPLSGTRKKVWYGRISDPFLLVRPALARFAKAPLSGRGEDIGILS